MLEMAVCLVSVLKIFVGTEMKGLELRVTLPTRETIEVPMSRLPVGMVANLVELASSPAARKVDDYIEPVNDTLYRTIEIACPTLLGEAELDTIMDAVLSQSYAA